MVPTESPVSAPVSRLPRSRGDGPSPWIGTNPAGSAPPLTRGWSPPRWVGRPPPGGSPAHAGMVPPPAAQYHAPRWLPRSRGDGPETSNDQLRIYSAPPLTRGWSAASRRPGMGGSGSPAHAGMVPHRGHPRDPGTRLPRSRGDGPSASACSVSFSEAPPLTRGWSPRRRDGREHHPGSPAHAGMVPGSRRVPRRPRRLPRSRGDGPMTTNEVLYTRLAPPLTRGWSPAVD